VRNEIPARDALGSELLAGFVVDVGSMKIGNLLQAILILFAMTLTASALPMVRALRINLAHALRVD